MGQKEMLTCRVSTELRDELDEIAKQRRLSDGEAWTRSHLMVEALENFTKNQRRKQKQKA